MVSAAHGAGLLYYCDPGAPGGHRFLSLGRLRHLHHVHLGGCGAGGRGGAFPLVYRSARAAFEGVDQNLEKRGQNPGRHGNGDLFPGVLAAGPAGTLAGVMLALARAMGEFGATLMVAGNLPGKTQTLSLAVYSATQAGNDTLANELVLLISAVCVVLPRRGGQDHQTQSLIKED